MVHCCHLTSDGTFFMSEKDDFWQGVMIMVYKLPKVGVEIGNISVG